MSKRIVTWVNPRTHLSRSYLQSDVGLLLDSIRSYGARYNIYDETLYAVIIADDNKFEEI